MLVSCTVYFRCFCLFVSVNVCSNNVHPLFLLVYSFLEHDCVSRVIKLCLVCSSPGGRDDVQHGPARLSATGQGASGEHLWRANDVQPSSGGDQATLWQRGRPGLRTPAERTGLLRRGAYAVCGAHSMTGQENCRKQHTTVALGTSSSSAIMSLSGCVRQILKKKHRGENGSAFVTGVNCTVSMVKDTPKSFLKLQHHPLNTGQRNSKQETHQYSLLTDLLCLIWTVLMLQGTF